MDSRDPEALQRLLIAQDGVVTRRQLREVGVGKPELDRMLRRREMARLFPGVFVNHTGPPTWRQRAWAAVLRRPGRALPGLGRGATGRLPHPRRHRRDSAGG